MSNPKLDFFIVIKTSIPSITKHSLNISPSSKHNSNQGRITFKPDISKPHLLSFLHSMYNSIKLNNHSSLNFKKHTENTNKLSHTPTENTFTSSDTNQDNKKMTKDAHYERSSQHSSEDLTRGRNG